MVMKFCYWDLRGFGASILNLLRYAGADFENIVLPFEGPPYTRENWLSVKFTLGLDFPNLPYLIDGDVKLTQSFAILRYLGRKYNLAAKADPTMAREDMILFQINDMLVRYVNTAFYKQYNSDEEFEAELVQLRKDLSDYLNLLEKYLQDGQAWLTGDKLSYVDFFAYEIIDWYRVAVQADCLNAYPKLKLLVKHFEELKPLKEYLASDEYRNKPITAPMSKFSGKRH